MPELILEIDKNNNPIGMRERADFYREELFHRSCVLLLFNKEGKLLLQKRSEAKKWFPGLWEFSASGTVGDESNEDCIARETKEELGIENLSFKYLFELTPNEKGDRVYNAVFSAKATKELQINFDKDEVERVRWISLDELKREIEENSEVFTPQLVLGIRKYFQIKQSFEKN